MNPFELAATVFNTPRNFRGKQRVFRAIFKYLPFKKSRSWYGTIMEKNMEDATYRSSVVGTYGDLISGYIREQSEPFSFFDIGANQGVFGICAAQSKFCENVVAFEPNPTTFSYLSRNIGFNPNKEKIHPVCAAIADTDESVIEFGVHKNHSGAASIYPSSDNFDVISALVCNRTLLRILFSGSTRPILKIDTEGAEFEILSVLDEENILKTCHSLIVEMNSNIKKKGISDIQEFLAARNWIELKRVEGYDDHYDAIYLNNAYQELPK